MQTPKSKRLCNVNIRNSKVLHRSPSVPYVHFFSKNLLGYLDTLVAFCPYYRADDGRMAGKMETFYQQDVHRYKDFTDKQLHQYITRKLTAWCQLYRPKRLSMESVDNENVDGEDGDIVNIPRVIPGGNAVNTTSYGMSDGDDEEREEESAAPAAAAESGGDGAGQPAAGGAAVDA